MNKKYKYLGKNTIIFAISSFGTKILSFLFVPLYTAILSTSEYGTADLITTTATLLVYILTINISASVLRFTLEQYNNRNNILAYGIKIIFIGTFICGIILSILYSFNFMNWPIQNYVCIILYFFASAMYETMTNYLRAIDKVKEVAIAGVISSLVIIVCNIVLLLLLKVGFIGYLISIILGPLISAIFCIISVKEPVKMYIVSKCSVTLKKEMIRYCIPLIFNNMALWINAFLDRYFVTYYCGVSDNGVYSVAGKIPTILSTCYSVFSSAWALSAIIEYDPKDKDGFFSNTYNTYGALMTMLCSVIILFNIPLAKFLYSKDFFVAWKYSSILLLSVMFNTLTVFQGSIFSAAKKTRSVATTTIISAMVNTVFDIILIPNIGVIGAAIATAVAYLVMWATRYIYLKKYICMKINIIKDILVYLILVVQICFEHFDNHFYIGQLMCLILIVYLNKKYLKTIIKIFARKFKNDEVSI